MEQAASLAKTDTRMKQMEAMDHSPLRSSINLSETERE